MQNIEISASGEKRKYLPLTEERMGSSLKDTDNSREQTPEWFVKLSIRK